MYEYTCPVCGKLTQVSRSYQVRTYCSRACSAKAREAERSDISSEFLNGECIFQPESIDCFKRECSKCGWNPEVAKARLDKIMGAV